LDRFIDESGWVAASPHALPIPAHAAALRAGGVEFLTAAFQSSGALAQNNRVTRITQFEECAGGSTGRKLLLAVEYEKETATLHRELFVKFSRDLDDAIRDRGRTQMELEVRFAQLSCAREFPIAVPACYFADYHAESGTGVLITQRIAYGSGGIEPHYEKCLDHEMPDALAHYRALLKEVARLAGAHRAGRLPADVSSKFPFEPGKAAVAERAPYTSKQLQNRVARLSDFAAAYPDVLPANVRAPDFLARLHGQVARFADHEQTIRDDLNNPDHIALCHWNANVDNAWFWRTADGQLECGLMDWGCVSQMNVAMAIWGAMSGAETTLWDTHFDELLDLFVAEFRASGGPALDLAVLRRQLMLYIAIMGLTWLIDAPPYIQAQVPDLAQVQSRFDPRITSNEVARTQLQMLTNFLNLWETQEFGTILDEFLGAQ